MMPIKQFLKLRGQTLRSFVRSPLYDRRGQIRLGSIFFCLILLPSGLLGYLSWRAIENEKMLSQERLEQSYDKIAGLAAGKIDVELANIEEVWISALNKVIAASETTPLPHALQELLQAEPLIEASFFLPAPGRLAYPVNQSLQPDPISDTIQPSQILVDEFRLFNTIKSEAEELEYYAYDLDGAIVEYSRILDLVANPQLLATAYSDIGRAQMKKGDWGAALSTFEHLLGQFPEVRDVNKMYMRFLAQYQIAVCLESLGREADALGALLLLNEDLVNRSDAIHLEQYAFFSDQIKYLLPRLLSAPGLADRDYYELQFEMLLDKGKKRRSQRYLVQLLDRRLTKMVLERQRHLEKFRYISDETEREPYLLAFTSHPDPKGIYTVGLTGIQIDLNCLGSRIFPGVLRSLDMGDNVKIAIFSKAGDFMFGEEVVPESPIATQSLKAPFDFWQVALYVDSLPNQQNWIDMRTTFGLWLVLILFFSILLGAYLFLRNARREKQLSHMKSTFVSNVSHELRTPLTSINMLAELLEMQYGNDEAPRPRNGASAGRYLQVIRRECERLGRLIEHVLDFSKVEHGVKQYNFELHDPQEVVHNAIDTFAPYAQAKGFELVSDFAAPGRMIPLDADAMSQAVLNLLSNALKYSIDPGTIRVLVKGQPGAIDISVSDNGIGIDRQHLERIFDEFYRVDQSLSSNKAGGMGLGLTLVKHIVKAHGGTVRVISELNQGSTFTMTLPAEVETAASSGEAPHVQRERGPIHSEG